MFSDSVLQSLKNRIYTTRYNSNTLQLVNNHSDKYLLINFKPNFFFPSYIGAVWTVCVAVPWNPNQSINSPFLCWRAVTHHFIPLTSQDSSFLASSVGWGPKCRSRVSELYIGHVKEPGWLVEFNVSLFPNSLPYISYHLSTVPLLWTVIISLCPRTQSYNRWKTEYIQQDITEQYIAVSQ